MNRWKVSVGHLREEKQQRFEQRALTSAIFTDKQVDTVELADF
jgi:hypothetical protein